MCGCEWIVVCDDLCDECVVEVVVCIGCVDGFDCEVWYDVLFVWCCDICVFFVEFQCDDLWFVFEYCVDDCVVIVCVCECCDVVLVWQVDVGLVQCFVYYCVSVWQWLQFQVQVCVEVDFCVVVMCMVDCCECCIVCGCVDCKIDF